MIYFTTFILALLFSHIACATSTCDDVLSPDDAIMYADAQQGQQTLHKPPITKPPSPTKKRPIPTKKPPIPTKKPPIPTKKPPIPTKKPPIPTKKPPIPTKKPPTPTKKPPVPKPPPVILYNVTSAAKYGNKSGNTKNVTCSGLAHKYPHFGNFPHFPYIGGAWNVNSSSSKVCGTCWNLTDLKTHKTIYIIPIDKAKPGWYDISQEAFKVLNGGKPGTVLQAAAKAVDGHYCGLK